MSFTTDFYDISDLMLEAQVEAEGVAFEPLARGGVTSARGFSAAGVAGGFRENEPERLDLALIRSETVARCAGMFTRNEFFAAPVAVCRAHAAAGSARGVIVNSGRANAATGTVGLGNAEEMARMGAKAIGCLPEEVLIASTGVIGQQLRMDKLSDAVDEAGRNASPDGGHDAACAIMTTDTHPKEFAVSWQSKDPSFAGTTFTVGGMAKGSGMIMPNMATMIAVIATDAPLGQTACRQALHPAVDTSFNRVTVDGDSSTNDTCLLLANGAAAEGTGAGWIEPGSRAYAEAAAATKLVCTTLARAMAADGEGATKLVTIHVKGAENDGQAEAAARTVANSELVKTAIFGHDANWGRVAAAIGRSGAHMNQTRISIDFLGIRVFDRGLPAPFDEERMLGLFEDDEILISVDLALGNGEATIWTCDLSHEYITINGSYRS